MDKKKQWIFLIIAGIILFSLFAGKKAVEYISEPPIPKNQWQQEYRDAITQNSIDLKYTQAQSTIDYLTPELQGVVNNMNPTSPEDAVKKTTNYVLGKIKYSLNPITADYCYAETATSAFNIGYGDCVSMVKLGTAILRAQGVAVRSVGGCVKWTGKCSPLMGVVPIELPKLDTRDGKKRAGGLHEWAEAWLPNKGWITVDFTNGAIYEKSCEDYLFYSYDESQYKDMCVINDNDFKQKCFDWVG